MAAHVKSFVEGWSICKETKAPNTTLRPEMGRQVKVERPWQRIYMNFLRPYPRSKAGNTFIFVILDQFTKFVSLKPMRKATAKAVCQFLEESVLHVFGFSSHYLVFGQNFVEHGSIYRLLRDLQTLPEGDVEVLPPTDFRMLVNELVKHKLDEAYKRHEKAYNTRSRTVTYKPDQEIFRRNFQISNAIKGVNAKLGKQWLKCRVVRQIGSSMYELADTTGKKINLPYHAKGLKS